MDVTLYKINYQIIKIIDHLYYLVWYTRMCKVTILKDRGGHFESQNGGIKLHDPDCARIPIAIT